MAVGAVALAGSLVGIVAGQRGKALVSIAALAGIGHRTGSWSGRSPTRS